MTMESCCWMTTTSRREQTCCCSTMTTCWFLRPSKLSEPKKPSKPCKDWIFFQLSKETTPEFPWGGFGPLGGGGLLEFSLTLLEVALTLIDVALTDNYVRWWFHHQKRHLDHTCCGTCAFIPCQGWGHRGRREDKDGKGLNQRELHVWVLNERRQKNDRLEEMIEKRQVCQK